MNTQPQIEFSWLPVSATLREAPEITALVETYGAALAEIGGRQRAAQELETPEPLCCFVLTGGTEHRVLDLWKQRRAHFPDAPVYLLAHPGFNALPAALESLARLHQLGVPGRVIYLAGPDDRAGLLRLQTALGDLHTRDALRQARIGLVGAPSDWLVASSPPADVLRAVWGPQVIPLPIAELLAAVDAIPAADVAPVAETLAREAEAVCEPAPAALHDAARVYVALRQLVDARALDALTVRCFDLVTERGTTGCFALAQLNDEGVIAGCEGDLVTTTAMLWAYRLLGQLPWMANPARLNLDANTLWLAHCTVPRALTQRYRLRSHFESGLGVGLQGTLPSGPVTLLRIGGADLRRIWLAEGHILRDGDADDLCRTQVEVRLTQGHVLELLKAPLGNHLTLIPGHHVARLRSWWEMMIHSRNGVFAKTAN